MYTKIARPVMWLLRGDLARLGGAGTAQSFELEIESFYMSRGCVTNEQYAVFCSSHVRPAHASEDDDPVVGVSFRDAVAYADWYAALSKKPFRLLTEAEWEFAARAKGCTRYPWGDDPSESGRFARTFENSEGRCHPVDQVQPSKLGIYGMIGNVWEWTHSQMQDYPITAGDNRDDLGTSGPRVIRGGGFKDPVADLSVARREGVPEDTCRPDLGFRIGRSL